MLCSGCTVGRCTLNRTYHSSPLQFTKHRLPYRITDVKRWKDLKGESPYPKQAYPWSAEPPSPYHYRDPRELSETWLAARMNDGRGNRSGQVQNFHWKVRGAYDLKALKEFQGHIGRLEQSDFNLVAIFRAAEGHNFCPGANLKALLKGDINYRREFYKTAQETAYKMATMKTPAFACMQGLTMGLGAGLSAHSLFKVVTEDAQWAVPNIMYGSVPECGLTYVLPRTVGEVGMYLALTGKRLDTTDIMRVGLGTHFIPIDMLSQFEQETSRIYSSELRDIFMYLNNHLKHDYNDFQGSAIMTHIEKINRIFGLPSLELIFQELEKDTTEWAQAVLQRLQHECSPLMLHVVFRMIKIGRYLNTLEEALELEYRVLQRVIEHPDYLEGIHSRVFHRRVPKWKHDNIYTVPKEEIAEFFLPTEFNLDLEPSTVGCTPIKNPFDIYVTQVSALFEDPDEDAILKGGYDVIFGREKIAPTKTLRDFYAKLMKEGGLDREAARYYYQREKWLKNRHGEYLAAEMHDPALNTDSSLEWLHYAKSVDHIDYDKQTDPAYAALAEEADLDPFFWPHHEKETG